MTTQELNQRTRLAVLLLCAAVAVGALVRCGGSSPSQPQPPVTTPTTTTTTTTQPAGIVLPAGMICSPTPPPLYGIKVGIFDATNPNRLVLDTKPLVINVDHYCAYIGAGDNKFCTTRLEGDPQLLACDYLAVGQAADTGRWGPTWTYEGQPCAPVGQTGTCVNNTDNQFKVAAKGTGTYVACASPLAKVASDEGGGRCGSIHITVP